MAGRGLPGPGRMGHSHSQKPDRDHLMLFSNAIFISSTSIQESEEFKQDRTLSYSLRFSVLAPSTRQTGKRRVQNENRTWVSLSLPSALPRRSSFLLQSSSILSVVVNVVFVVFIFIREDHSFMTSTVFSWIKKFLCLKIFSFYLRTLTHFLSYI